MVATLIKCCKTLLSLVLIMKIFYFVNDFKNIFYKNLKILIFCDTIDILANLTLILISTKRNTFQEGIQILFKQLGEILVC